MIAQISFELPELVFVRIYDITADGVFFDAWMHDEDIAVNVITGGSVDYGALVDVVSDIKEVVQYTLNDMYAYPPAIALVSSIKPRQCQIVKKGEEND